MGNARTAKRWFCGFVVGHALAVLAVPGCGRSGPVLQAVTGRVTFQGKSVEAGVIRFCNAQAGIDMTAALGQNGAYEIVTARGKGLPEGTYEVAITPPRVEIPMGPLVQPPAPPKCDDIPKRYHEPTTSRLTVMVASGNKSYDFDLAP